MSPIMVGFPPKSSDLFVGFFSIKKKASIFGGFLPVFGNIHDPSMGMEA